MTENAWIDETVSALSFHRLETFSWSPPTDADFERLATNLGAAVPSEYRHFISRYGAVLLGDEDYAVYARIREPCSWGDKVSPEIFYPLLGEHPYSMEKQLLALHGRIPDGVLPIADDAGGNQVCLDVAGKFPGSVWFWDHEQRWFTFNLQDAAEEIDPTGRSTRRFSVHDIVREWARRHAENFDRPPDYMGMYRMAPSFADFLRSLYRIPY